MHPWDHEGLDGRRAANCRNVSRFKAQLSEERLQHISLGWELAGEYRAGFFDYVVTQEDCVIGDCPSNERRVVMKTLKNEFQSEAQRAGFATLEEPNSALWAWIDVEYNRRNHSTTGEPPNDRFAAGLPEDHRRIENLEWFEALFLVRDTRSVHKYGLIKLEGNKYRTQVPHGTVIEVRYNPFDLSASTPVIDIDDAQDTPPPRRFSCSRR